MSVPAKSPQVEDGFVRIANELFDAITGFPLKYTTLRVLLVVIRKTYGYGKKEDDMSASQIAALCGDMARTHVSAALNELAALNIIFKRQGAYGSVIGVNKDYSTWKGVTKSVQMDESRPSETTRTNSVQGVTNLVQVGRTNLVHTKDNLPKDNQQKKETADAVSSAPSGFARLALISAPPPVAALPLKDGSEYEVSADQVAEWSAAYPKLDIPNELLKMRVWLRAKPQNRKTRRGIGAFIVGWLGRAKSATPGTGMRASAHGNFDQQDYHAGVAEDGTF